MENRLKERLTGAAIIVTLIVLLVPEMFRGQRTEVAANSSSSGEGPPLRSYTIDLSNSPARNAPIQSTNNAAPGLSASSTHNGVVNDDSQSAAPTPTPSGNAAAGSSVVAPAASAPPSAQPSGEPRSILPKPTPLASASHPALHSEEPPASASSSAGGWNVQLGIFAKRENAERLAHAAQAKGFAVSVSSADAKVHFRVRVTGLSDRGAAQSIAARLKAQGFAAAVVAPQ